MRDDDPTRPAKDRPKHNAALIHVDRIGKADGGNFMVDEATPTIEKQDDQTFFGTEADQRLQEDRDIGRR